MIHYEFTPTQTEIVKQFWNEYSYDNRKKCSLKRLFMTFTPYEIVSLDLEQLIERMMESGVMPRNSAKASIHTWSSHIGMFKTFLQRTFDRGEHLDTWFNITTTSKEAEA